MGWLTRTEAAKLSEEQRIDYLTRTILGEAVGEGFLGMTVVAQVISNRAQDGRWPADPVAVAGQPWQFSTNNPGEGGNQGMVNQYGPNTREYKMAREAVQRAIIDKSAPDITGGGTHYHTVQMGWPKTWPTSIRKHGYIDVGNHRIYPERPVPPGSIPDVAAITFEDRAVGTQLSVKPKFVMPTKMPADLRANRQAETARRAQLDTMRRVRATASAVFFDKPAANDQAPTRSVVRATGTIGTTQRIFDLQEGQGAVFKPKPVERVTARKPSAVSTAPWGVRETVAANVAAADAAAGRGQLVMTGNPNIAGSVVDWLYPSVAEGQGEANQAGKGNRARADVFTATQARTAQAGNDPLAAALAAKVQRDAAPKASTTIFSETTRRTQEAQTPGAMLAADQAVRTQRQEQLQEQAKPRVVVSNGTAKVVTPSRVNTDETIRQSLANAEQATQRSLAVSLAANVAAKRTTTARTSVRQQQVEQAQTRQATPQKPAPSRSSTSNVQEQRAVQQQTRQTTPVKQAPPRPTGSQVLAAQRAEQQATRQTTPAKPAPPKPTARQAVVTQRSEQQATRQPTPVKPAPAKPVGNASANVRAQANEQRATRQTTPIKPAAKPIVPGPNAPPKTQARLTTPKALEPKLPTSPLTAPKIMIGPAPNYGKLVKVTMPTPADQRPVGTTGAAIQGTGVGKPPATKVVAPVRFATVPPPKPRPANQNIRTATTVAPASTAPATPVQNTVQVRSYNAQTNQFESRTVVRAAPAAATATPSRPSLTEEQRNRTASLTSGTSDFEGWTPWLGPGSIPF